MFILYVNDIADKTSNLFFKTLYADDAKIGRENKSMQDCVDLQSDLNIKQYKNTLTSILRKAEKNYYDELLCQSKSNVKKTWGTINAIIKRNNQSAAPQTV